MDEQKRRNDEIIAALRSQFQLVAERLTPEIEPAPVYSPHERKSE